MTTKENGLLPSEQILIDALAFYAKKEHWMPATENADSLMLCAIGQSTFGHGWAHAHGQLQRWSIAKHFENERANPPPRYAAVGRDTRGILKPFCEDATAQPEIAEVNQEFLSAIKEVIRISDRNHKAWDTVKIYIQRAEAKKGGV